MFSQGHRFEAKALKARLLWCYAPLRWLSLCPTDCWILSIGVLGSGEMTKFTTTLPDGGVYFLETETKDRERARR